MVDTGEFWNDRPLVRTPYYCNICKIYCASPVNLQTHFLGYKHKSVENALKSHGIVKPLHAAGQPIRPLQSLPDYIQTEPERELGRTLEEQLDSCQDTEPAIGLQYITEYQSADYPFYDCSLCGCQTGLSNMFMHVLGVKHRLAYLKRHYPETPDYKGRGSSVNKRLKELAAEVEKKEGRKSIRVTKEPPVLREDRYSVQLPDSLVTWFSEDDVGLEKKKEKENPKLGEKEAAKKVEEAAKNVEEAAKNIEEGSKDAEAKAQCDNSNKSEKQQDQNTESRAGQQKKAELIDCNLEEEFVDNEDLLKYLQSFEILDEQDASFILKIIQKLTNSLVMYRYISEKKNAQQPYPEEKVDDQLEPFQITSMQTDGPSTGFSGKQPHNQMSGDNEGTKLNVKSNFKRKASRWNPSPLNDNAKSRKLGTYVSTFKEVPREQVFPDADTQDAPAPAAKIQESPAEKRNTPAIAERKALPSAEKCSSNPTKHFSTQSPSAASSTSRLGPSTSESPVIAQFFNSIRNMEVDEVASTLHKIAASNPAFRGMDVQNVIQILTKSGNLKPKNTNSAR